MIKENGDNQKFGLLNLVDLKALIYGSVSMIVVYLLLDSVLEIVIKKITGLSIVSYMEQEENRSLGTRFHVYNLILFSAEIILVMFFYAMIRPAFNSKVQPVIITALFFLLFSFLFLAQMVNLGMYPPKLMALFMIMTAIELPVSLFWGAYRYDKMVEWE